MDYSRPRLADRLAANYVLGTLRGAARRRLETLLPAHPSLRQAVNRWQDALVPLASTVPPVAPTAAVWTRLETRLFGAAEAPLSWWQRLLPWRAATGVATAAALVMGVALSIPPPAQSPVVIVMSPNEAAAAGPALLSKAKFVASVSGDGRALVLKPLDALPLDAGRALELWAVPAQGAPRSLGLVAGDHSTQVLRAKLLKDTAAFAVSVEPDGGSPTGAPTGPIISVGKLET
ncbi:anti-sigma factor [Ideonella margarita]|uniref:Anti-sigma factor n=1 Tax=Ideonella margarita TaxID=2984191 RepID=A0ABU9C939_9BURK